jgi:hypothetical protein
MIDRKKRKFKFEILSDSKKGRTERKQRNGKYRKNLKE